MEVTLTLKEVLYVAGAITAIAVAINWVAKGIGILRKPKKDQDNMLKEHQARMDKYDIMLDRDKKRLDSLEQQNKLTMQALLALLEHSCDGNNIEQMKKVKKELSDYLISK